MAILGIVIFAAAALNFELCLSACSRAEYEKNGVCCSKCAPGSHVHLHCTADANTTCVPCPALTYTGEPNGRDKCFHCTKCKAEFGLRAIKSFFTVCRPHSE
ncbi:hypothetical protein Q8A67_005431 [Cirrhinus molitorella]|uniref:TNFR-Cys domain-containing protein n=1 Tax=Cirrhinus molitorella TaxID=172907 RepID=A0AA88U251_9TELE|nr:hypothetical protein Q8A67_005431 [Cirrhinus molitorella]